MDTPYHNGLGPNAPVESPDLPDGWRRGDIGAWTDPLEASRKRLRVLRIVALVGIVLACLIGFPLWNAATHYARGRQALEAHSYSWAVIEFSAARVFALPYRDARSLEEQARSSALADDKLRRQADARRAAVIAQLEKAGTRLEADDAQGVLTTLQAIDTVRLQEAFDANEVVREEADALAEGLFAASGKALRGGAWGRAGRFAAALLVLEPSSARAVSLQALARTGQDLSAKVGEARDAARHGRWREALRIALAVLAVQKDFPGAAAVVADARHALAPKPKPAATQPAPAASTAVTPTQPVVSPPRPPAPEPPPP